MATKDGNSTPLARAPIPAFSLTLDEADKIDACVANISAVVELARYHSEAQKFVELSQERLPRALAGEMTVPGEVDRKALPTALYAAYGWCREINAIVRAVEKRRVGQP